jgi:hypothetical protein
MYASSAAANFRSNLMRSGNLPDATLRGLEVPCLLITSAKDRMLPSIVEGELAALIEEMTSDLMNELRVVCSHLTPA